MGEHILTFMTEAEAEHAKKIIGWQTEVQLRNMTSPDGQPCLLWVIACWYVGADKEHDPFFMREGGYVR